MTALLPWLGALLLFQVASLALLAITSVAFPRLREFVVEFGFALVALTLWPFAAVFALAAKAARRFGVFVRPRVVISTTTGRVQSGRWGFYRGHVEGLAWNARWIAVGVPNRHWLGLTLGASDRHGRPAH